MNSPLDTLTKRFTPCVIICPCDKWLSQQEDTVGNSKVNVGDVFDVVKEDLFPRSLMGATMQDGGTRERRSIIVCSKPLYFILIF